MDLFKLQQGEDKESRGMETVEEIKDKEAWMADADEAKYYNFIINRIKKAREAREKVREEFDDMTYEDDYWLNRRAVVSYLKKKKNDSEVRIVGGTTEKKIEFVLNQLLQMNLQPEIKAFDQNDAEIVELGESMEDIVRRTNEMELDEDRYTDALIEFLSQRAVFVEELWVDIKDPRGNKKKRIQRCEKRVLSGLQVYLADINLPAWRFNSQPYIIKYERMTYLEAQTIYGSWERWCHVKPGVYNLASTDNNLYRSNSLGTDEVEVFHYMSYQDNEYQIFLNGIMMMPVAAELPWGWDGYNMTMVVLKPISVDFAYGKSLASSAKTLQALDDETFRNLVRKTRQSIEPPVGVKAGRIYSKDIWDPGSVVQGVKAGDFEQLINHQGVNASEMQMLTYIENKVSEFIGTASPIDSKKGRATATEIVAAQKQIINMLGLSVIGAMRLKRNMTFLRIYNVFENYTKPSGKKMNPMTKKIEETFQKFTVHDSEIDPGVKGKKIIHFMNRDLTNQEALNIDSHERQQKFQGNPVKLLYINYKALKDINVQWYVSVVQKERDSSELSKAMMTDMLGQAQVVSQLTGRQLNADKVVEKFETTWKYKDLFQKQAPQQQMGAGAPGQGGNMPPQAQELMSRINQAKSGSSGAAQGIRNQNVPSQNQSPSMQSASIPQPQLGQ